MEIINHCVWLVLASPKTSEPRSLDCDGDAVLLQVGQVGGACQTGNHSCFDADVLLEPETR
jgi:hypothetical protein